VATDAFRKREAGVPPTLTTALSPTVPTPGAP
jgi:hypothetical protein